MQTVAGVFRSREAACEGAGALVRAGFSRDRLNVLFPDSSERQIHSVPTSDTEQPGMGGALGGVLGATLGATSGFELGIGATALIPGAGPVLAVGIAGAALLGAGGLVAGVKLGQTAEQKTTEGVPADEVFFYEDALRQGRSVVIFLADGDDEKRRAEKTLEHTGAESVDGAREAWWIGLRDTEAEHYRSLGHSFDRDQEVYRAGFEAALRRECRGRTLEETADCLKWRRPEVWDLEAFHRGFERGRLYLESLEAAHPGPVGAERR